MCLAVPLQLVQVDGPEAIGEVEGIRRKIRVDFLKNPQVGDYVIAHAGFAIETLKPQQALENLQALREVADGL